MCWWAFLLCRSAWESVPLGHSALLMHQDWVQLSVTSLEAMVIPCDPNLCDMRKTAAGKTSTENAKLPRNRWKSVRVRKASRKVLQLTSTLCNFACIHLRHLWTTNCWTYTVFTTWCLHSEDWIVLTVWLTLFCLTYLTSLTCLLWLLCNCLLSSFWHPPLDRASRSAFVCSIRVLDQNPSADHARPQVPKAGPGAHALCFQITWLYLPLSPSLSPSIWWLLDWMDLPQGVWLWNQAASMDSVIQTASLCFTTEHERNNHTKKKQVEAVMPLKFRFGHCSEQQAWIKTFTNFAQLKQVSYQSQ